MPNKTVPIDVFNVEAADKVAVAIEQTATGLVLDPADMKFKASDKVANPLLPLVSGKAGTIREKIARVTVTIDAAKGWADGRYSLVYYVTSEPTPRPFAGDTFDVWMGEWRPFTSTDIVLRMMDASATPKSTVRQAFAKIESIYGWVSKQPGFTP